MPDLKKILSDITAKVTGDDAAEVKTLLKQLEGLYDDKVSSLQAFGQENKEKRLKIEELEKQVRDMTQEKEQLTKQVTDLKDSDEKKELEALREKAKSWAEKQRTEFKSRYDKIAKHPAFEKVKDRFGDLKPNEKGEIDWEKVEDATIENLAGKLDEYESIGLFFEPDRKKVFGDNPPPANPGTGNGKDETLSEDELSEQISQGLKSLGV
ncbi:MAG: hypothetical protein K9N34_03640 [Candidatus Marinimicrobia bacterium]|nr:hypothetical protein [Candidatus Neomarinimicrobiota bacterium]MCF7839787.1 hypothetical protein [Candidatus Neomarinimicrobiota bacterium]